MVLKVFSVCLMVLDLDRKKVNLIHLWILCVQEPAGEMPNNFPTQSYLKINTRVFVTECTWGHQSHISGNLPGLSVGMMLRAETEVSTEGATNSFFYSQYRENGCDYLTLKLGGLGWAELYSTNVCCSAHSQAAQCRPWVSWTSPTRLGHRSLRSVKMESEKWSWSKQAKDDDLQFVAHLSKNCDHILIWFLWLNSFICWHLFFGDLVIMCYFCFLFFLNPFEFWGNIKCDLSQCEALLRAGALCGWGIWVRLIERQRRKNHND